MTIAAPQFSENDYLTDGRGLIYVVRIESNGDVLAEDALTTILVYMTKEELTDWRRLPRGT